MTRVVVITAVLFVIHTISLFGAAGTISWPIAWAVLGVYFLSQTFSLVFLNPDLLRERASPGPGVERFDRLIATLGYLGLYEGTFIVSGFDTIRFGPAMLIQNFLRIAALVIFIIGYAIGTWAAYTNRFSLHLSGFRKTVGIQLYHPDLTHGSVTLAIQAYYLPIWPFLWRLVLYGDYYQQS